jgi:transcription elongation factor Elf1
VAKTDVSRFDCPNCGAKYKLVRVEVDPQSPDRQITCRNCGAPFHGRQGALALKYFLVDRPRTQARARRLG